jgi:hypothetical protein
MELLREEARLSTLRRRQEMKVGGMVLPGTGPGLLIFLYRLIPHAPICMVGLMLMLIGAAVFGSSYFLSATAE